MLTPGSNAPSPDPDAPYLEMLGPTNNLIQTLEKAAAFDTNHLSIMCD